MVLKTLRRFNNLPDSLKRCILVGVTVFQRFKSNSRPKLLLIWSFGILSFQIVCACSILGGGFKLERSNMYSYKKPPNWKVRAREESDRAFTTQSGQTVTLTSSCKRSTQASLQVLTRQLLIGTRNAQIISQEEKREGDLQGLHTVVSTDFDGKKFHMDIFVAKHDDCIFDFSLLSPKPIEPSERAEFLSFVSSVQYGKH